MDEILSYYVEDFYGTSTTINGVKSYVNGDRAYFIIPVPNSEEVHYEQKAIGDFLINKGFDNIATPMYNYLGRLITSHENKEYMVCYGRFNQNKRFSSNPEVLASFHQVGIEYPYQPNYISSYGQWKSLWIEKVNGFEQLYQHEYQERPVSRFKRLFIDTFPYLIGISENAIQYLQESERDNRFHDSDRPTITFQRYSHQLTQDIVWSHDLVYDHPVRDLAEYIRPILMENDADLTKVITTLQQYEGRNQLSVFGWRLLYARLLFPIHLYDFLETRMNHKNDDTLFKDYKTLLEKQYIYERNIKAFYKKVGINTTHFNIPVLDW